MNFSTFYNEACKSCGTQRCPATEEAAETCWLWKKVKDTPDEEAHEAIQKCAKEGPGTQEDILFQLLKEYKSRISKYKIVVSEELSTDTKTRYVIVDSETNELLDDADGVGFKTEKKALAKINWTLDSEARQEAKRRKLAKEIEEKSKKADQWMVDHKDFITEVEARAFRIMRKRDPEFTYFSLNVVSKMLHEAGFKDLPFTGKELFNKLMGDQVQRKSSRPRPSNSNTPNEHNED